VCLDFLVVSVSAKVCPLGLHTRSQWSPKLLHGNTFLGVLAPIVCLSRKKLVHKRRRRTPSPERGPGMNEVSFCARPYHNVHNTLGVGTGATSP
jgi:hypothetical protein